MPADPHRKPADDPLGPDGFCQQWLIINTILEGQYRNLALPQPGSELIHDRLGGCRLQSNDDDVKVVRMESGDQLLVAEGLWTMNQFPPPVVDLQAVADKGIQMGSASSEHHPVPRLQKP